MMSAPSSARLFVKAGKFMPPEGGSPGDPHEWLRRARSNLARSTQGQVSPDVLIEDYERAVAIAVTVVLWASGIVTAAPEP